MDSEMLHKEIQKMRQNRTEKSKNREYWSDGEIEKVSGLFYGGVDISEIALEIGRTEKAVFQKINGLKLYEAVNRPQSRSAPGICRCNECMLKGRCQNCGFRRPTMFDDYPDILTPEEVCDALRLGRNTVYECLAKGEIASFRQGRI